MSEGIRFQQYRLSVISVWPESEVKQAALASARAALEHELAFDEPGTKSRRALPGLFKH